MDQGRLSNLQREAQLLACGHFSGADIARPALAIVASIIAAARHPASEADEGSVVSLLPPCGQRPVWGTLAGMRA